MKEPVSYLLALRASIRARVARAMRQPLTLSTVTGPVRVHLGCGTDYRSGWINVDVDARVKPDIVCDFMSLGDHFPSGSASTVQIIHAIGYLRLWEARDFFCMMHDLLQTGGTLVMEFPDVVKCARVVASTNSPHEYVEAVRAIYAFDLNQIRRKEEYTPYAFGWSGWHIRQELAAAGFSKVELLDPETHDRRVWRDTRVIAEKS